MSKFLSRGALVTLAGAGINLALGVLYTWSVVAKTLTQTADQGGTYLWTSQQANWPYAVAVGTFALMMVFAGRAQDRLGPRWVATAGGVLVGSGLLVASLSPTTLGAGTFPTLMTVGFGLLTGSGIGLAYAATTPAAVKWFHPSRKGLITGIVVGGFGMAPVYAAPLTTALLKAYGVSATFQILGVAFLVVIVALAQLLRNPDADFVPAVPASFEKRPASARGSVTALKAEYSWHEMLRKPQFYVLWLMYMFVAFAGLMMIGHMAKIAAQLFDAETAKTMGFVLVVALALGNGTGRPVTGIISDRIGRKWTMVAVFLSQAVVMLLLGRATSIPMLLLVVAAIGFNYGANLTLFPATTADYFGTRNLGVNYGLLFTAWGIGGVFGSQVAAGIVDRTGSYAVAYTTSAVLCLLAVGLAVIVRPPRPRTAAGASGELRKDAAA